MKPKIKTYENEAYELSETDYLNFVTRSSTEEQRRKFDIGDLFINGAVCLDCKDFIRSINRHDYRKCKCGNTHVDGGSWYAKRVGENYVDVIEYFYDVK